MTLFCSSREKDDAAESKKKTHVSELNIQGSRMKKKWNLDEMKIKLFVGQRLPGAFARVFQTGAYAFPATRFCAVS